MVFHIHKNTISVMYDTGSFSRCYFPFTDMGVLVYKEYHHLLARFLFCTILETMSHCRIYPEYRASSETCLKPQIILANHRILPSTPDLVKPISVLEGFNIPILGIIIHTQWGNCIETIT